MTIGVNNVEKLYNVGIIHLFKKGYLADGRTRNSFIFSLKTDLLKCDDSAGNCKVTSFVDDAIGPWELESAESSPARQARDVAASGKVAQRSTKDLPSPIFSIFW